MIVFKNYILALFKSLPVFLVAMLITFISNEENLKYVLGYFFISNYVIFYPYIYFYYVSDKNNIQDKIAAIDENNEGGLRRSQPVKETILEQTSSDEESTSVSYFLTLMWSFLKVSFYYLLSPLIFMYYLFFRNEFNLK